MSLRRKVLRVLPVAVALTLMCVYVTPARAADADILPDEILKKKKKKKKAKKKKDGWHPKLDAGFTFAFSQSQGVVGVTDGISTALGLVLNGGLEYRYRAHAWITTLNVVHTQSKVPGIDPFIKSADRLDLTSYYRYRFPSLKMLGVIGGVKFTTALLPGSLVLSEDTAIDRTPDDPTDFYDLARAQKAYRLTDAFSPALFKQFLGGMLKPHEKKWLDVDIKLGLGGVEVWTQNGYVVKDDKATAGVLELKQLLDYQQVGAEIQLAVTGVAFDKLLTYGLHAEVMYPFYTSIDTGDLKGVDLFNVEFKAMVGIKLWKWLSLNYALSVLRIPLILEEWQVTNTLLLTVKANIVK
jgi:hypothetical protein